MNNFAMVVIVRMNWNEWLYFSISCNECLKYTSCAPSWRYKVVIKCSRFFIETCSIIKHQFFTDKLHNSFYSALKYVVSLFQLFIYARFPTIRVWSLHNFLLENILKSVMFVLNSFQWKLLKVGCSSFYVQNEIEKRPPKESYGIWKLIQLNMRSQSAKGPKVFLNWAWKCAICMVLYGAHNKASYKLHTFTLNSKTF